MTKDDFSRALRDAESRAEIAERENRDKTNALSVCSELRETNRFLRDAARALISTVKASVSVPNRADGTDESPSAENNASEQGVTMDEVLYANRLIARASLAIAREIKAVQSGKRDAKYLSAYLRAPVVQIAVSGTLLKAYLYLMENRNERERTNV